MKKYLSLTKKKFSEYIRDLTSLANPIILFLVSILTLGLSKKLVILILFAIINEIIGSGIKFFFHKKRPNKQEFSNSLEKIDAGSFPSIHSSRIMLVYLTLIFTVPNIIIKSILVSVILIVGYSRIFLKKHFLSDVIGGYILGFVLFYLMNVFF